MLKLGTFAGYCELGMRTGSLFSSLRHYAGHSHWQNVRHIKAAKDKIKSSKAQHFTNLIRKAMRENQSSERIKEIVTNARAQQVPQSTLDRALQSDDFVEPYVTAARATGGIFVLIESNNSKIKRERQLMSSILKKYGFKLQETESVAIARDHFDHLGVIVCEPSAEMKTYDDAMELGLEVGAEEVESVNLSELEVVYQFQCNPRDVSQLTETLKEHGASVIEAEERFIPKDLVQITPEVYKSLEEMYERIRDNCDGVDRVFDNVEVV